MCIRDRLVALANYIGRNNRDGEPDPKGTVSSTRPATQNTFYSILFRIWHWEDATRFWNQHTNPEREEVVELRAKLKAEMAEHSKTKEALHEQVRRTEEEHQKVLSERSSVCELKVKVTCLDSKVHDQGMTIMELKAKLYDLMTAGEN